MSILRIVILIDSWEHGLCYATPPTGPGTTSRQNYPKNSPRAFTPLFSESDNLFRGTVIQVDVIAEPRDRRT
ncbi:MAG: hypothetical protein WBG50_01045, partial [Desulfomonilaceae bacterium]